MTKLVTVVVPNFNGANYLRDSIDSVLAQDYTNLEVIVVDDGSTDASITILESYAGNITLVKQSNKGSAAARNSGLSLAKGEFIALLDSDDVWIENKLSTQMSLLEEQGLDLVYCAGQEFSDSSTLGTLHVPKYSGDCSPYFRRFPTKGIIELGCSTAVFRASLLEFSGLFDESFLGAAEDWDFFRRYTKFANVGYSSEVLVKYRKHSGSITARSLKDYYEGNRYAIVKMFHENPEIGLFEKRVIWIKFHLMISKSYLKISNYLESFKSLLLLFSPLIKGKLPKY
jgi:glycosyltransferase involved in cell wall biosynthesis